MHIVDVSNPANPVLLGVYSSPHVEDVVAAGPYAYLAEGYRGWTVLDVTRPVKPFVVSSCGDVYAVGLDVTGEAVSATAYVRKRITMLTNS